MIDKKVQISAANGLSLAETEAVVGHKLSKEELQEFNKTKALLKLKKKKDQSKPEPQPQPPADWSRMPSLKERYSKKEVEQAIVKCNGRWAAIQAMLNCSYYQLQVWMEHHKDHRELSDRLRLAVVDEAEEQLYSLLHSPDSSTRLDVAKFILKTLGRSRGWTEQP